MWFKNLLLYRFTKPFTLSPDELGELLAAKPFSPCGSQDMVSRGWTAPVDQDGAPLVHTGNGCLMMCLQRQEKVLPAGVINEVVAERIAEIREQEDRKVGRKEKGDLREQVVFELLPRAFARSRRLFAYIDTRQQLLVINSGSRKQAEDFMVVLRDTMGSLPVVPFKAMEEPSQCMTRWLGNGDSPAGFTIGGACELQDRSDTSTVVKCRNLDLQASEIRSHVESGMLARQLELHWSGGIEFVVDDNLAVKRLRFDDVIMDQLDDVQADSAAEQFDADFALMTAEFDRFIPALLTAFGGAESPAS